MSEKRFVPSKYASHTFDRKTEKHYYVTDEMIGCKELFEEIEKLEKENEQLREKVEELSFNDYKRCLEIINHQRVLIQKIEKLTGQTIEELIINLDKGVGME